VASIAIVIPGAIMTAKDVDARRWIGPKTMVVVFRPQRGMTQRMAQTWVDMVEVEASLHSFMEV